MSISTVMQLVEQLELSRRQVRMYEASITHFPSAWTPQAQQMWDSLRDQRAYYEQEFLYAMSEIAPAAMAGG